MSIQHCRFPQLFPSAQDGRSLLHSLVEHRYKELPAPDHYGEAPDPPTNTPSVKVLEKLSAIALKVSNDRFICCDSNDIRK